MSKNKYIRILYEFGYWVGIIPTRFSYTEINTEITIRRNPTMHSSSTSTYMYI